MKNTDNLTTRSKHSLKYSWNSKEHVRSPSGVRLAPWPRTHSGTLPALTRSSAIHRESAHLTWLYCTVQKAFQYEIVLGMDHECDSTAATSVE